MTLVHDDLPHPVPPVAYLRYKENWFFLILDRDNDVFGAVHVVGEPGLERIRFSAHLSIQGTAFGYSNEIRFPMDFALAPEIGDGVLSARFVSPHEQIDLSLSTDDVDLQVGFHRRSPVFDFRDYDHANPDKVSIAEIVNFATNQQNVHQQQGMYARGQVAVKSGALAGTTIPIDAYGYRDHSRSVRCDNMVATHTWTGLHFPDHVFGVMTLTGLLRPDSPSAGGYVYDEKDGLRALRDIELIRSGRRDDGLPDMVDFHLTDIYGTPFHIRADITGRHAHVPLLSERPGAAPAVYHIVENFAPLELIGPGDTGIGLVEIGWSVPRS